VHRHCHHRPSPEAVEGQPQSRSSIDCSCSFRLAVLPMRREILQHAVANKTGRCSIDAPVSSPSRSPTGMPANGHHRSPAGGSAERSLIQWRHPAAVLQIRHLPHHRPSGRRQWKIQPQSMFDLLLLFHLPRAVLPTSPVLQRSRQQASGWQVALVVDLLAQSFQHINHPPIYRHTFSSGTKFPPAPVDTRSGETIRAFSGRAVPRSVASCANKFTKHYQYAFLLTLQ
jgi:hypothetical protein